MSADLAHFHTDSSPQWTSLAAMKKCMFLLCVCLMFILVTSLRGPSCGDKCGNRGQGCSCQASCLLYRNCCEDFLEECPGIAAESREKYKSLLDTTQPLCTGGNFFIVSGSCEEDNDVNQLNSTIINNFKVKQKRLNDLFVDFSNSVNASDPRYQQCWTTVLDVYPMLQRRREDIAQMKSSSEADSTSSQEVDVVLLTAISQLHVTEPVTSVVYADIDTFLCHAQPGSVPCLWNLQLDTWLPDPLGGLTMAKDRNFHNVPPSDEDLELMSPSLCINESIDECNQSSRYYTKELKDKCDSFTSYVMEEETFSMRRGRGRDVDTEEDSRQVYRNIYCLQCVKGTKQHAYIKENERLKLLDKPFYSLIKMQGSSFAVELVESDRKWNFETTVCDLTDSDVSCVSKDCLPGSVRRSDGICRREYRFVLAMTLPDRLLKTFDLRQFRDLLQCVVEMSDIQFDFDFSKESFQKNFAATFILNEGVTMFGSSMSFYEVGESSFFDVFLDTFSSEIGIPLERALREFGRPRAAPITTSNEHLYIHIYNMDMVAKHPGNRTLVYQAATPMGYGVTPFCGCVMEEDKMDIGNKCRLYCHVNLNEDISKKVSILKNSHCVRNYFGTLQMASQVSQIRNTVMLSVIGVLAMTLRNFVM